MTNSNSKLLHSYFKLPDVTHLKPCLLYMALFPEDHKIPVVDLLKLWMAEEFVLNVETENMEEASRNCLSDLLNRSLVMVSGMRINGDVEYCSLHDVVHHPDYQLDKFPMLDFKETNSLEFIAHLKLNTWNNQYWNPLDLLVKLRFVRALHLMDVALPDSWATAMQSLTELRYLVLHVRQFELEWISHIHNLQTLQLKSSKNIRLRAATLWELKKLRHVNIDSFPVVWEDINDEECSTSMLENMKSFGTCDIRLDNMNARLWWRFPNLEELGLQVEDEPKFPLFPVPEVHTRLHSVSLKFSLMKVFSSVGWEKYFVFPSNLRHLNFSGCVLTEETVLNIARLKKLESLKLFVGFPYGRLQRFRSCSWDVTNVEFPALKYLTLQSVMMKEWKASEESFPVLEKLVIRGGFIKEIPPSLRIFQH
ncbi:hypothetical protein KY285_027546 [Solanum tuberosum]|nr:hypothetical protein KY289_027743 [Solanum tuberosum]KAH0666340.1 hypothetical protein KY285_027546 [Solanum tuberosum]